MVSNNNVKRSGRKADLNECLPAIPRPGYLGCWTSKHHCNHVPDGFFILDNQDLQRVAHDSRDRISRTWAAGYAHCCPTTKRCRAFSYPLCRLIRWITLEIVGIITC